MQNVSRLQGAEPPCYTKRPFRAYKEVVYEACGLINNFLLTRSSVAFGVITPLA